MEILHIAPTDLGISPALHAVPTLKQVADHFCDPTHHHGDAKRRQRGEEASQAWDAFVADVAERGVQEPLKVILSDNPACQWEIVDGRHRYLAALEAGLEEVPCVEVCSDTTQAVIAGTVIGRRHFSKTARAWLAVTLNPGIVSQGHGGDRKTASGGSSSINELDLTQAELAHKFGVSTGLLSQVVEIFRKFSPSPTLFEQATWLIWAGTSAGGVEAGLGFLATAENDPAKVTKASTWNTAHKAGVGMVRRLESFTGWTAPEQQLFVDHLAKDLTALPEAAIEALQLALSNATSAQFHKANPQPEKTKKEDLFTCPLCNQANFLWAGIRAHVCPANGNQRISKGSLMALEPQDAA